MRLAIAVLGPVLVAALGCNGVRDIVVGSDIRVRTPDDASTDGDEGGPGPLTCEPGRADCDGARDNGCEVDLGDDEDHCGTCDRACDFPDCDCEDGTRVLDCPWDHADCDGRRDNGCEVDLGDDEDHCGQCDRACDEDDREGTGEYCDDGRCVDNDER